MESMLGTMHSVVRWLVLVELLSAVLFCAVAWRTVAAWSPVHKIVAVMALVLTDIQLLIGGTLWWRSPLVLAARADMAAAMKDAPMRFFAVEHPAMMLLAVIAVHVGYAKAKRAVDAAAAHKAVVIGYGAGVLLMLAAVPWPFRALVGRPLSPW